MNPLINHLLDNHKKYFWGALILALLMIIQVRHPGFDSSFETLGIKEDVYLTNQEYIDSLFQEGEKFAIEVVPQSGNFWQIQDDMLLWEENLREKYGNLDFRSPIKALSTLYNKSTLENTERSEILQRLAGIELFENLIGKDLKSFLVVLEVDTEEVEVGLDKFNKSIEDTNFQLEYEFNTTSRYHIESSINNAMLGDLTLIIGLLFFFFVLIMLMAYRSLFAMLYLVFVVGLSMALAMAIYQFVEAPLNLISVMVLPVTVVLSAANAVHLLTGYFSQDPTLTNLERIKIAYQKYLLPSLLTSITTSVAFFSLCINDTQSVSTLGWLTGVSVIISFLACYTLSPFIFRWAPSKQLVKHKFLDISNFFINRKRLFSYLLMPILVIAVILLPKLTFKNNFELFLPIGSKEKLEHDKIRDNYYSQATLDVLIDLKDTIDIASRTLALKKDFIALDSVVSVRCSENNSVVMTKFFMPVDIAKVSGYKEKFVRKNGQLQRFQIGVKNPDDLAHLEQNIHKMMEDRSGVDHIIASVVLTYENVNKEVGKSLIQSLLTSSFCLFLVFFFLTRSFIQSFVGLFVNLVPLSLIVIIFVGFDLNLNIMTSITAVVCLGIIVDDTIHSFYRRVVRKKPLGELSFGMLTTTLILVVGFGIFSISNIKPVGIFGSVAAVIFVVTLISDFTLLLYLIDLLDKRDAKKEALQK